MKLSSSIPIGRVSAMYEHVDVNIDFCEAVLVDLYDKGVLRHFGSVAVVICEDNLPHDRVPDKVQANLGRLHVSFELPDGRGGRFELGDDESTSFQLHGLGPGRLRRGLESQMARAGRFEAPHFGVDCLSASAGDPGSPLVDLLCEGRANAVLDGLAHAFRERVGRFEHPRLTRRQSYFHFVTEYRRLLTSHPHETRARAHRAYIHLESRLEYEESFTPIPRAYPDVYLKGDVCRTLSVRAEVRCETIPSHAEFESVASDAEQSFLDGVEAWKKKRDQIPGNER